MHNKFSATDCYFGIVCDIATSVICEIHCESKKLCHFYFYCNFGKCWSIFKILSMSESERREWKISHCSLTFLLHYLVKLTLVWMFAWNCGGSMSRNTRLHFSRFVASKQSRSQSSWLRDMCCHVASCIPEENPRDQRTEAEADWSLVRPWTVDCRHGCWSVAQKT